MTSQLHDLARELQTTHNAHAHVTSRVEQKGLKHNMQCELKVAACLKGFLFIKKWISLKTKLTIFGWKLEIFSFQWYAAHDMNACEIRTETILSYQTTVHVMLKWLSASILIGSQFVQNWQPLPITIYHLMIFLKEFHHFEECIHEQCERLRPHYTQQFYFSIHYGSPRA